MPLLTENVNVSFVCSDETINYCNCNLKYTFRQTFCTVQFVCCGLQKTLQQISKTCIVKSAAT